MDKKNNIKRLFIGIFIIAAILAIPVLLLTRDTRFNLSIEDRGEKKYFSVRSNLDGDLGNFLGGGYDLKLSEGKHLITLKSARHSNEYYVVDAKKNSEKFINVDFTKNSDTKKLVPDLENEFNNSRVLSCGYFSEKTWIHCGMSYGQLILKKENNKWNLKAVEEYISEKTLDELNVPEDLLLYSKDD